MALDRFLKTAKKIHDDHQRPRPKEETHAESGHDEGNWLISYADMMTLLCGFFIMLFSMAKLDEPKYEAMREAMSKEFRGTYVNKQQEMAQFFTHILEQSGVEKQVLIQPDPTGVQVIFESTLFFDTLNADLRPEGRIVLDRFVQSVAKFQQSEGKEFRIVVEGHTDSRPIMGGIFPSNWELSAARASRVVRLFLDRGFIPGRMTAIGYADTRPVAEARTPSGAWNEAALAKNRRVVLRILNPGVDSLPIAPNAETASSQPQATSAVTYGPPSPATPAH